MPDSFINIVDLLLTEKGLSFPKSFEVKLSNVVYKKLK